MRWYNQTLIVTASAIFTCLGLSAQEPDASDDVQIQPTPVVQTYSYAIGNGEQVISLPLLAAPSPYYGSWGGDNGLNRLHDPSVMKDLELVDDQISRIGEVRKEYQKLIQTTWKEYSKAQKDPERMKEIQKKVSQLRSEQNEALSDVLLPHQLTRIKQVAHQIQMQAMGGESGALQHGALAKELDITDEQKKKLAEIQKKMNEDIAAKTKELRAIAKKQVLAQLTAKQKSKLDELTGEEFKRDPKDWQEHRRQTFTTRKK